MSVKITEKNGRFTVTEETPSGSYTIGYYATHQQADDAAREFLNNPPSHETHRIMYQVLTTGGSISDPKEVRMAGFEDACKVYADWVEEYDHAVLYREEYASTAEYEEGKPGYSKLLERHP